MANIAVLGHGVVGSGVLEVLTSHAASIAKRAKEEIHVKYILDLKEFPGLPYSDRFTKDFNVILNDPEVQIVVEVMGGLHPAYDFVKACLENGKSVVTVAGNGSGKLKYQTAGQAIAVANGETLDKLWTDLPANKTVDGTTGQTITVVEVDGNGRAVAVGSGSVTAKAG